MNQSEELTAITANSSMFIALYLNILSIRSLNHHYN